MKSYKLIIKPVTELPVTKYNIIYNFEKYFEDVKKPKLSEMVHVISDWTDMSVNVLYTFMRDDIYKAFKAILKQLDYKPQGKDFIRRDVQGLTFRFDYDKMSAGWWNHLSVLDVKNNPLSILSLVYIEKGMNYAEVDKFENISNPSSERQKILEEHLKVSDFIDIAAFFLNTSVILNEIYSELNTKKTEKMAKSMLNGVGRTH